VRVLFSDRRKVSNVSSLASALRVLHSNHFDIMVLCQDLINPCQASWGLRTCLLSRPDSLTQSKLRRSTCTGCCTWGTARCILPKAWHAFSEKQGAAESFSVDRRQRELLSPTFATGNVFAHTSKLHSLIGILLKMPKRFASRPE